MLAGQSDFHVKEQHTDATPADEQTVSARTRLWASNDGAIGGRHATAQPNDLGYVAIHKRQRTRPGPQ